MDRDSALLLLLVLAVVGGGLLLEYDHRRQQADSRPVDGVVLDSGVTRNEDGTVDLALRYRYTVDGEQYTSSNVCAGIGEQYCHGNPRDVAARYPEGASVTVYVDPDDPSESFLVKDDSLSAGGKWAIIGVLFGLVALVGKLRST